MRSTATVLLLDDGELNAVGMLLFEMGMDLTWKSGAEIRAPLARPADILVTNRKRALEVPHLIPDIGHPGGPAWVCIHHKDFPSLREFLREVGAHFLVHSNADEPEVSLLRLLFQQLGHRGAERRTKLRLPCACRVQCTAGGERFEADLRDLSLDSCRIETHAELRVSSAISVYFPSELDPAAPTAYPGVVLRTQVLDRAEGVSAVVIGFEEAPVQAKIAAILAGQGIGTRIIQLAEPPARTKPGEPVSVPIDRRENTRRRYGRRVACLMSFEDERPHVVMAHDLCMKGIGVDSHPALSPGARVIVALPQGKGINPLLLEGTVQREADASGTAIEFVGLDRERREALRRMLSKLTPIDPRPDELEQSDLVLLSEGLDGSGKGRDR